MRHHGTRLAPVIGGLLWLIVFALQVSADDPPCAEPSPLPNCYCVNTNKTDFRIPTGHISLDNLNCGDDRWCVATLRFNNDAYNKPNGTPITTFGGLQVRVRKPGDDSFIPTDVATCVPWHDKPTPAPPAPTPTPAPDYVLNMRVFRDDPPPTPPPVIPNLRRDKTFILYAVSSCPDLDDPHEPFNVYPLRTSSGQPAEVRVQFPTEATGTIVASPNPCIVDEGTGYGTTKISSQSEGAPPSDFQSAVVTVQGTTNWVGRCFAVNSRDVWRNVHIFPTGKTFRLWVVDADCTDPDLTFENIISGLKFAREELDSVWVDGELPDAPLCPFDGRAMVKRLHGEPSEVLGLITNGMKDCSRPGNYDWCVQVADVLSNLGVRYIRQTVKWSEVHDGGDDWSKYDTQFAIFRSRGIEPWITLSDTPCDYAASACRDSHNNDCSSCPPQDIEAWRDFVRQAAGQHFGTADIGAENWDIYQEPQGSWKYWDGTVAEWTLVQNAAYEEIHLHSSKSLSPRVWGANLVYRFDSTDNGTVGDLGDWIEPHFDGSVMFDGFNMHVFFRDYPDEVPDPAFVDSLPLAYGWVHQMRRRLNESGMVGKPLAITAVSWHAMENLDPWSFSRLVPEAADRQQNLIDAYACLANAARAARGFQDDPKWVWEDLDHIFWFNAVQNLVGCPCNETCDDFCEQTDEAYCRLGVLCRRDPTNTVDAPLRTAVERISDWLAEPEE